MRSETHELGLLAADFDRAADEITDSVKRTTGAAMNKIKRGAQRRVRGNAHLPHLARSFTYDVTARGDVVTGEVGAEHDRPQGKIDVFIEHGTPTSEPIPHWAPEADFEVPVWLEHLDRIAGEALE